MIDTVIGSGGQTDCAGNPSAKGDCVETIQNLVGHGGELAELAAFSQTDDAVHTALLCAVKGQTFQQAVAKRRAPHPDSLPSATGRRITKRQYK